MEPRGDGTFTLHLEDGETQVLRGLLAELRLLLVDGSDPSLRRLFPPAYAEDEERDREYQALAHDELLEHRLAGIDIVASTLDQDHLDEEQLGDWLRVVNQLRLVIGTQLDVHEDEGPELVPDDPDAAKVHVYHYLGYLLEDLVDAMSGSR